MRLLLLAVYLLLLIGSVVAFYTNLGRRNIQFRSLTTAREQVQLGNEAAPLMKIVLKEEDLEESFVKGSGNGGQKINKTSNRVVLVHIPTGVKVSCQDARDLSTNRKIARKLLVEKLDVFFNGKDSKLGQEQDKIRKRKKNAQR